MRRLDVAIAAVVLVIGQVHIWVFHGLDRSPLAAIPVALGALVLAWRRRAPLLVGVLVLVALFAMAAISTAQDVEPLSVGMVAALWTAWFTLGAAADRRASFVGLGLGALVGVAMVDKPDINLYLAIVLTTFVVPWLVGAALLMRKESRETRATPAPSPTRLEAAALTALTRREGEVLTLMVEGLSNNEIAERLHVSLATVKSHVVAILRKLGVRDRTQAVVMALSAAQDLEADQLRENGG